MILDEYGSPVANYSQPTVAFTAEVDYNNWVAGLPNGAADVEKFVVYKMWEMNSTRAVQCYDGVASFPTTGLTHTLYIDTINLRLYVWDATNSTYVHIINAT